MKLLEVLLGLSLAASIAHAESFSQKSCPFNIVTGKFFDLSAVPPEKRLDAYKEYLKDVEAKNIVSKPCPDKKSGETAKLTGQGKAPNSDDGADDAAK